MRVYLKKNCSLPHQSKMSLNLACLLYNFSIFQTSIQCPHTKSIELCKFYSFHKNILMMFRRITTPGFSHSVEMSKLPRADTRVGRCSKHKFRGQAWLPEVLVISIVKKIAWKVSTPPGVERQKSLLASRATKSLAPPTPYSKSYIRPFTWHLLFQS